MASKTLLLAFATTALTFSASAYSAQFSSIIDVIAIPKNVEYNVNGWEDVEKIQGIEWEWPYYESGAHDSTMVGTTKVGNSKNPNIGYTQINVNGARTFITNIEIMIQNEGGNPSKSEINKLFGSGEIIKIASSCDQDYATWADATYQFKRSKEQPVFIRYGSSWGASGSGAVTIAVANNLVYLNDYDDCYDKKTLEKWSDY
ncbi:hypothetical protein [Psychrobacter sp. DAB_AL62B]|uniref:hypothetical protein n=1 Tax=Psychrobacter sp. DAB_AL62B TaxID=1028420 RepID=UPI0023812AF4|nr:hypothetical protein [Psychrobacter sp. DAB_AL62B]MDE4454403.1 hypothetical protein [Psychrobacter sp. DAB_AL62B]